MYGRKAFVLAKVKQSFFPVGYNCLFVAKLGLWLANCPDYWPMVKVLVVSTVPSGA